MDQSVTQPAQSAAEIDDWDNDDFVIPSLAVGESVRDSWDAPGLADKNPTQKCEIKGKESIYLGPHGAPPSQAKIKEISTSKNKSKEIIIERKFKSTHQRDFNRNNGKQFTKRNS
ncbi:hypothetical protein LUZ60_006444 [Juncus effusus]|nr:hypothetical protein LUZ60_006444 [Juncus effusus]